jgi:peptide chain release factor
MISQEKWRELEQKMESLGIDDKDLIEKFILGSGSGGQKINKTSSCVYLKHLPTGIEIKCQQDRSREVNRYLARKELCERLASQILQIKTKKQHLAEKIRRQKRRRSRRSKEKMLAGKKMRSEHKSLRQTPKGWSE